MEDYKWYCSHCDVYTNNVYDEKNNDPRHIPCMQPVNGVPDPPYDHTGHDTLEEKHL